MTVDVGAALIIERGLIVLAFPAALLLLLVLLVLTMPPADQSSSGWSPQQSGQPASAPQEQSYSYPQQGYGYYYGGGQNDGYQR